MATSPGSSPHTRRHIPAEVVIHLRRARDLIDRRFAEQLDLEALAAAAGFSRYHFARSFRAAYGETPAAYLTRRRIERAKRLLGSANPTVTEGCHLVGFQSLGSFSSRFSELVGMAPSVYQRRSAELGGPPPVPGCYVMAWSRSTGTAAGTASQEKRTDQLRSLVAAGSFGAGVLRTDECRATYTTLSERGVVFVQEPTERPYGVEAVFRDDSGNWFSLTEPRR
jgi:AraC-like DNA-binding protein